MPAFEFDLRIPVQQGQVAVGKFDGKHPALACATPGGKVFLHSPHERAVPASSPATAYGTAGADDSETPQVSAPHTRFLNVNRQVSSIGSGFMPVHWAGDSEVPEGETDKGRDLLFVGTSSTCLAYDVLRNADVFVADTTDGASSILVDRLPGISPADDSDATGATASAAGSAAAGAGAVKPVVVAGGHCSLQAFDEHGEETAWLVTSDVVTAMTSGPGLGGFVGGSSGLTSRDLLVASDDMELRAFRGDSVVMETSETAKITALSGLAGGAFAYSLENGTVGVYRSGTRLWRVKTKGVATSCLAFDLDADGDPEVLSGWDSGKLEARRSDNGALVYRERAAAGSAAVAGLVTSDYRMGGGDDQAVVIAADGTVRGFLPVEAEAAVAAEGGGTLFDAKGADDVALEELQQSTRAAELKLLKLRESLEAVKKGAVSNSAIPAGAAVSLLPVVAFKPSAFPTPAQPRPSLQLLIKPSSRVQLRCAVALSLDAAVFHGESRVAVPLRSTSALVPGSAAAAAAAHAPLPDGALAIPVTPPRNTDVVLRVKCLVGAHTAADRFLTLETTITLPEFAAYRAMGEVEAAGAVLPAGGVQFEVPDRAQRVALWLQRSFLASEGPFLPADGDGGGIRCLFVCMRPPRRGTLGDAVRAAGGGVSQSEPLAAATLAGPRALPSAGSALRSAAIAAASAQGGGSAGPSGAASARRGAAAAAAGIVAEAQVILSSGQDAAAMTTSSLAHDGLVLCIEAEPTVSGGGVLIKIRSDSMSETADVVQSLAASMNLVEVVPKVAFPAEMKVLFALLPAIQEAHSVRMRLSADLAEGANRAKALVVRAEDSRMMGDITTMRAAYARLMAVNGELSGEHAKRASNHEALMKALRRVNSAIQLAARMRIGAGRAQLVNACRAALKANNTKAVFAALQGTA